MKMEKVIGSKIEGFGIEFGSEDEVRVLCQYQLGFITGTNIGHVDIKLKNGFNYLKLVKNGKILEVYLNSKLIGKGSIIKPSAGSFRFVAETPYNNGFVLINFDDIKFHITKKGEYPKPELLENSNSVDVSNYTPVINTAPVLFKSNDYKYGFKDRTGKIIVAPTLYYAWEFIEGMASVEPEEHKYGYIDVTGNLIIKAEYADGNGFGEGLAAVKKGENWGFINRVGKEVLPFIYESASRFHDGLCPIKNGNKYGYINKNGTVIIPYKKIEWASEFSEGRARIYNNKLFGFIDLEGNEVIPCTYSYVTKFSEGLAAFRTAKKKWGFIDSSGKIVIDPVYDPLPLFFIHDEYLFSEGLVAVKKEEEYMFINKQGKKVISLPGDIKGASPFENGKSKIQLSGSEYYINRKGEVVQ